MEEVSQHWLREKLREDAAVIPFRRKKESEIFFNDEVAKELF